MSAKSCKSESNVRNMSEESTHGIPPEKKLRSVQAVCLTQVESQPSPQRSDEDVTHHFSQGYNNTLITDELLRLVTPVIPISEWRRVAYEAFNLTVNQVDAIESAATRSDVIFHLLHQAVERDKMPAKVLKEKIEIARADGINIGQKGLENIEAGDAIPSSALLMNLSKQLEDYDSFLVGYMGCTLDEVRTSMYLSQDHKICVLKMLSLWRCKDGQDEVKTVGELLSVLTDVLHRGPYKVLENLIKDWWGTKSTRSNDVTRNYMQTNMPVSNIEAIQSQLKAIYTNTLSTLCPLPWLEEAGDVMYNFDDVFIPLRTIDINIPSLFAKKDRDLSGRSGETGFHHQTSAQVASMRTLLVNGVEKMTTTSPRNILIQSVAGGGKSTLCNRLAYLWANNSAEIQRLDNFDLVFLIKVNLIQPEDKSIYDYINSELLPDVGNICDVIKDLRTLFIVDGYDELRGKENVVEDLLAKRVCPQSTVILTTREGQTPPLKYFSNAFGITRLPSEDVQTFLSKLPRNTDATLTQTDLDTHPLGAILSIPLFLWFYYLLGEDIFKGVDVSSRTSLFTHILDGILLKAADRLNRTEAECREAVEMLQELAYKCLCDDKLHFDKPLSDLSANIGLVKQSLSQLKLELHTTYTFTHKSLAEFLTARYIVSQTNGNVVGLLSNIPELQDPQRRYDSLILYFVFGFLGYKNELVSLSKTFIPEVTSQDSHTQHLGLQCAAEMRDTTVLTHVLKKRVHEEVECSSQCNQYCALGIKRLYDSLPIHIRRVTLSSCSGDFTCRFLCLDAARAVRIQGGHAWESRDSERLCDVTEHSLQRLELWSVDMTTESVLHLSHYISRGTQLKELELVRVWEHGDKRSLLAHLLQHLSSHPHPSLHYLRVRCEDDSYVRALTIFLPQCTNLRTLQYQRAQYSVVSESVEKEMWEVVVRRCRKLEEVRVGGEDSNVSCARLVRVMRKLSEREEIQALKLKRIVRVDREQEEDYTKQVKHLLPALQKLHHC